MGSGLRPFGICLDFLNEIGPPVEGDGVQYVIEYGRDDQSTVCGTNVPGNWSVLDFDGGSNPQGEINCWVEYGYGAPECPFGDDIVINPVPYVEGNPGAFTNAMKNQMDELLNADCFILPVYTIANDLGGGNAEFNVVNFAGVKLVDYKLNGPQDDRYFTIEFVPCVTQGTGGGPGGFGAKVIGICAVDATDPSVC